MNTTILGVVFSFLGVILGATTRNYSAMGWALSSLLWALAYLLK